VRPRSLTTRVGTLRLQIPRDRAGLFRPTLFAKYERSEQAFVLAMVEMYFQGVSTRKVSEIVEVLCGTSVSASEISALTRKLDVVLSAWRSRPLTEPYAYLCVDAHVERVRREGHVRPTAALWVVGITPSGYREHLGVWLGASETTLSWSEVFRDRTTRGLKGVEYVVADDHAGSRPPSRASFPPPPSSAARSTTSATRWTKSRVKRSAPVSPPRSPMRGTPAPARKRKRETRIAHLVAELQPLAPRLADWLSDTYHETLACYVFEDPVVRRKLRSTNAVERHHSEVRRRTYVIRIFPHEASLLRLLTALALEQTERWSQKHYISAPRAFRAFSSTPNRRCNASPNNIRTHAQQIAPDFPHNSALDQRAGGRSALMARGKRELDANQLRRITTPRAL
jgi:putative transposase